MKIFAFCLVVSRLNLYSNWATNSHCLLPLISSVLEKISEPSAPNPNPHQQTKTIICVHKKVGMAFSSHCYRKYLNEAQNMSFSLVCCLKILRVFNASHYIFLCFLWVSPFRCPSFTSITPIFHGVCIFFHFSYSFFEKRSFDKYAVLALV